MVECELGWRAQFAYPYEVEVYATSSTASAGIAADYAIDVTRCPRAALKQYEANHAAVVTSAERSAANDKWYESSIYGIMDRSFLKPYHEEVMARLDKIEAAVASVRKLTAH